MISKAHGRNREKCLTMTQKLLFSNANIKKFILWKFLIFLKAMQPEKHVNLLWKYRVTNTKMKFKKKGDIKPFKLKFKRKFTKTRYQNR